MPTNLRRYARNGVYTSCVDLGAYTQTYTQQRSAYHFREMDLFYIPPKSLRIGRGRCPLANGNPTTMRKRRRIVGVFILCIDLRDPYGVDRHWWPRKRAPSAQNGLRIRRRFAFEVLTRLAFSRYLTSGKLMIIVVLPLHLSN